VFPTAVINVVGLTTGLLGPDTPHLNALRADGGSAPIPSVLPAVTCTAQATYLTGTLPRDHGVVGNGWYFRDLAQVMFWRQANQLVIGEKVWDIARRRDAAFTCAQMFWWFNMYAAVDWSVTPRPIYPADGRKIPDIYSYPADLCGRLTTELGPFPFFEFWGPNAGLPSSEWIASAAAMVDRWFSPTLLLVYLPHLDYDLQRYGADGPLTRANVRAIDDVCGRLIAQLRERGRRIIVVSEYGLTTVRRPIHINRALREAGLLVVRDELGLEALDAGASAAFAVADHQVAHVYVNDVSRIGNVKQLLLQVPGVDAVLDRREQAAYGLDHERSGELIAISDRDAWFTYYYWLDDRRAPDYARTVDIHRKPGYDPAELFLDPSLSFAKLRIGATLVKKRLGFRYLLNVIPLDATLVRGSHGRRPDRLEAGPLIISSERSAIDGPVEATGVRDVILAHLFEKEPQRAGIRNQQSGIGREGR
jgi:predicted AlkP superfamily pyrophosphatase or phosphodiesterase